MVCAGRGQQRTSSRRIVVTVHGNIPPNYGNTRSERMRQQKSSATTACRIRGSFISAPSFLSRALRVSKLYTAAVHRENGIALPLKRKGRIDSHGQQPKFRLVRVGGGRESTQRTCATEKSNLKAPGISRLNGDIANTKRGVTKLPRKCRQGTEGGPHENAIMRTSET